MQIKNLIFFVGTCILLGCSPKIPPYYRSPIEIFVSVDDFLSGVPTSGNYYARLKEKQEDYVFLSEVFDARTHRRIHKDSLAWAIRYKGEEYIHLKYTDKYFNENVYAKFDIVGDICAMYIDDETSKKVKSGGTYTTYDLSGYLDKEIKKWGDNWKNKAGDKCKVLTINT